MDNTKSGFVGIIGRPNVGKSTLMNSVIGQKVAIVSDKPQTTRNRIQTVYTTGNTQMVFLDTPGLHKAKNKLGNYMVSSAKSVFADADVILYLVEASEYIGPMDKEIIEMLATVNLPVVLVINKVDKVTNEELLKIIDTFSHLHEFADIVPVSALKNKNTDELIKVISEYLPEAPFYFDPDEYTDQTERELVKEIIREKALRSLSDEVPHGIAVTVDSMEFSKQIVNINATIYCERESHKGIIIGKGGEMLKRIGSKSRADIERMLDKKVNLKIWVKVKNNWRDSEFNLKDFGYQKNKDE